MYKQGERAYPSIKYIKLTNKYMWNSFSFMSFFLDITNETKVIKPCL